MRERKGWKQSVRGKEKLVNLFDLIEINQV